MLPFIIAITLRAAAISPQQAPAGIGKTLFTERCAACHGVDGTGGTAAPAIVSRIATLDDSALRNVILNGAPTRGMPAFAVEPPEMAAICGKPGSAIGSQAAV